VLLPGLVASIYGANIAVPGRDRLAGTVVLVAGMLAIGSLSAWLLGTLDRERPDAGWLQPARQRWLFSLALLAMASALLWILRERSSLGLASIALFSAAVMTYHRHYDMTLLLPTLAYFLNELHRQKRIGIGLASLVFGGALIAPSHPRIAPISERIHGAIFITVAYAALMILITLVAGEPKTETSTTPTPPGGEDRGR